MTNDTTTLNGALQELGETMADNLVSMGVTDADPTDGLTTLAGKILDVEPSISGLDLDTALTLSSSSASIIVGQSIVLSSKLTASYDDETLINVDLSGVLTGATILFKEGNTQIGSSVTDSTGTATATISGLSLGSHTIKAVFAGTENFDDCESTSITVVVSNPTPDSMVLVKSAGKQILSYADVSGGDEYCTVKATVYDASENPLAGETVTFSIGGTTVKSDVTDSNGEITYTYNSQGSGDVTITADCRLLIQTYTLEDCFRYDDASTDKTSNYTLSTIGSFTHDTDHYILSRTRNDSSSTNYYSSCYIDDTLPSDFEISVDYMYTSATNETQSGLQITNAHITTYSGVNECLLASRKGDMGILYRVSGSLTRYLTTPGKSLNVWYNLLLKIDGTSVTAKITKVSDDTVLYNQTETLSNIQSWKKWQIVLGESSQTVQWKNFKIKPL